jgi:hypothetical protein
LSDRATRAAGTGFPAYKKFKPVSEAEEAVVDETLAAG